MEGDGGLQIFREALQSLIDERPLADVLDLISRRVSELAGFDFCAILLPEPDHDRVHVAGSHRFPPRYAARLNHDIFVGPVGHEALRGSPTRAAIEQRRTVVMSDVLTDDSFRPWQKYALEFGFRSIVSVPLLNQDTVIGVFNGYSSRPRTFTPAQLSAVEALTGQAALAVRMTTLVEARQETIATLTAAHEIHLRLTETVIAGSGFQAVAQTLAELISRPVAVTDATGHLICTSEPAPDAGVVATALAHVAVRDGDSAPAVPIDATVIGHIRVGPELLGHVVVEEGAEAPRDIDLRAVEHAATVLALEIVKERVARATEERLRADFLSDLLSGREDVDERIGERARYHGLSLGVEHRVLVISLHDRDRQPGPMRARVLRLIDEILAERLPGSVLSRIGKVVTAAVPTQSLPDQLPALHRAIAELRRRAEQIAPDAVLSVGIGRPVREPRDFADSHRDALLCLDVLRRLDRAGQTVATEDLGMLRLLLEGGNGVDLAAIAQSVLGPVVANEACGGALFETLDAYLDCGADVRACGERLYLHANTVRYRLHRVEELCNLDLRNPNDLLQVTLARTILKLHSGTVSVAGA